MEKGADIWVMEAAESKVSRGTEMSDSDIVEKILKRIEETIHDLVNTMDSESKDRRIEITIHLKRKNGTEVDIISCPINTVMVTLND